MKSPKQKGYRAEVRVLEELSGFGFRNLERLGSIGYHADSPDLIQRGKGRPVFIVAVKDAYQPTLYCLRIEDLERLAGAEDLAGINLAVQVKSRKTTWIGGLYRGLVAAYQRWDRRGRR